jgi:signal transduction histidine kinase
VFRTIEETGRQALGELDRLLGILRSEQDGAAVAPPEGLDQLPALATRFREAGLPVVLRVEGEVVPLPRPLELSAYRIVQEALTNCLRHAGPATATVTIRYAAGRLELEIADDGRGAYGTTMRGGRGLVGIKERVALFGGQMHAGTAPGGGFVVRCSIPLEGAGTASAASAGDRGEGSP